MSLLTPRVGTLGIRLAKHLLRRTTFRITSDRINDFANKTATEAVNELFAPLQYVHPEGPINPEDLTTAWLTTGPYSNGPNASPNRPVKMWFLNELMLDESIRHKLSLFFHSIFVTSVDNDWRMFDHYRLLQFYALDNIKTLTYKMTLDNKMLIYLDNQYNTRNSPNENYAREFLELFTILKGNTTGTGNYTNYTEHDVSEAARVLTGIKTSTYSNTDPDTGLATGVFDYASHDRGNKTFSAAFQNQTILGAVDQNDMERELSEFIDLIFDQLETARAFVRRLYLFFVSDKITSSIETGVIEPLANQLFNDNYELENTLKTLLKSVHFYDEDDGDSTDNIIGGKIKPPLELWFQTVNLFKANQIGILNDNPMYYGLPARDLMSFVLEVLGWPDIPLSVEGYPGFFKGPGYSRAWFDQSTVAYRYKITEGLLTGKSIINDRVLPFQVNVVNFFTNNFTNQEYADQLVTQLLELAFSEFPDPDRYDYFLNKLLGSLSDINWFFEWQNYLNTGNASEIKIALEDLFEAVIASPEYNTF